MEIPQGNFPKLTLDISSNTDFRKVPPSIAERHPGLFRIASTAMEILCKRYYSYIENFSPEVRLSGAAGHSKNQVNLYLTKGKEKFILSFVPISGIAKMMKKYDPGRNYYLEEETRIEFSKENVEKIVQASIALLSANVLDNVPPEMRGKFVGKKTGILDSKAWKFEEFLAENFSGEVRKRNTSEDREEIRKIYTKFYENLQKMKLEEILTWMEDCGWKVSRSSTSYASVANGPDLSVEDIEITREQGNLPANCVKKITFSLGSEDGKDYRGYLNYRKFLGTLVEVPVSKGRNYSPTSYTVIRKLKWLLKHTGIIAENAEITLPKNRGKLLSRRVL
jgi:hypothetical protein